MKDNRKTILVVILAAVLVVVTVAYALLQTDLNIVGQATIGDSRWDIHFENLNLISNIGGVEITKADLQPTKFSLMLEVEKPADSVTYTFDVTNAGTINAVIQDIVVPDVLVFKEQNLLYTFTYEDGSEIKIGDALNSSETKTVKLVVEYDRNVNVLNQEDLVSKELDLSASILYVQA